MYKNEFIYIAPKIDQITEEVPLAMKFPPRTHLLMCFLKAWNIPYNEEDLIDTPFGKALDITDELKETLLPK